LARHPKHRVDGHFFARSLELTMSDLKNPNYKPANLLDTLLKKLALKNDAQLAAELGTDACRISRFRHAALPIGDAVLIRMNELAGMAIGDMREMMGLPRRKYIGG
jgi:hypothetical protein